MTAPKNKAPKKAQTRSQNKSQKQDKSKRKNYAVMQSMLFFCLAIVGIIGMMHPLDLEPFDTFNNIMKYMLGRWHILLPFVFLIISVRVLLGIKLVRLNTSFVSFIIFSICGPALFHHIRIPMNEELIYDNLTHGGGLWGGTIALVLHKLIGNIPTLLILSFGCLFAVGLLIPWGELLSSKKRDEEYEEFLKETEKINEKNKANKTEHIVFHNEAKANTNVTKPVAANNAKQDVYGDEEFSSFTEGIKSESTFKKIIRLGSNKDKDSVYDQDAMNDPIEIPEWEESKREVVLRPAINYGSSKNNSAATESSEAENTVNVSEPEETSTIKPYQSIIHNPYHKEDEQADPSVEEPKETNNPNIEKDTTVYKGFVIHRPQEEQEEAAESKAELNSEAMSMNSLPLIEEDTYNPAFDGYVDAQQALNQAAMKKQGLAKEQPEVKAQESKASVAKADSVKQPEPNIPKEPPKPVYIFPPYDLLSSGKKKDNAAGDAEIMEQCSILEQTLKDFRVRANVVAATRGPAVTQFELQPAAGVKVNSVVNLADDIALRLAAPAVRIEAPIPGKSAIGIEVPNVKTDPVSFREVVDTDIVRKKDSKLCIGLGKDISGDIITADIAKMPHLLIAGSTGSGKSVCINTIICGILYKALPEEVKLILVDPKVVELSIYDGIPHLLTPVVTEPKKAASALHWAVAEMERRYKLFADNHVRNIDGYNKEASEKIPYIVIIIDEMADLMVSVKADIETAVMRLAAKARAAGIHMILATQRPSVDVITGVLKNNIPSRIAFAVTSLIDSRTILDSAGAEKLLGKGDMLYSPYGSAKPTRVQGAFVSDEEVGKIVSFINDQSIPVEYSEEVTSVELESDKKPAQQVEEETAPAGPTDDPLFEKALMLVLDTGQASASMMQRRFSIGYNRAARLVDTMAELGVVGKAMGSKPREVIMSRQEAEERFFNND